MKKSLVKIWFILVILLALLISNTAIADTPLQGKSIVLDAGHGGIDPGTIYQNIYEKDINLAIVLALKEELINMGANVILTRSGDYDLSKPNAKWRKKSDFDNRIKIINNKKNNLYISIHMNYLEDKKYFGPQVFYNQVSELNKDIALKLQTFLNSNLNTDREIKLIPNRTYMYDKLTIPGILIECGFLSNAKERNMLISTEYQKKIAKIIADGLKDITF